MNPTDQTQIILYGNTYYTSNGMYAGGYGACCECGTPHQLAKQHKICNRCSKPFIVIRQAHMPCYKRHLVTPQHIDATGLLNHINQLLTDAHLHHVQIIVNGNRILLSPIRNKGNGSYRLKQITINHKNIAA